jgi:hypothetical protein
VPPPFCVQEEISVEILIILLILLLVFGGGGYYTGRPAWTGPDVSGLLWILAAVVVIVFVVRLVGLV